MSHLPRDCRFCGRTMHSTAISQRGIHDPVSLMDQSSIELIV
ncbi:hypothetical protein [Azospirillum palustre]